MEQSLSCSFFGHRYTDITDELKQKVKDLVEDLIVRHNVTSFLFGSNSDFDYLCRVVVTELKEIYPHIKRVHYTCKSEYCILETEREKLEKSMSLVKKCEVHLIGMEEEVEHKTKYTAGRLSYVERNRAMIDDSDYCIFYYDKNYKPEMRRYSKRHIGFYWPKSGTAQAYVYALQKKRVVINVND